MIPENSGMNWIVVVWNARMLRMEEVVLVAAERGLEAIGMMTKFAIGVVACSTANVDNSPDI